MEFNHVKWKQLFRLKNIAAIVIDNLIYLLIIFNNNLENSFFGVSYQINVTLINCLLFVPICVFLICTLFNDMPTYRIRFESKNNWIKNESRFIVTVLIGYIFCHVIIVCLAGMIQNLIVNDNIGMTFAILCGIIFYVLSLCVFVLIMYFMVFSLYLSFKPDINRCGIIVVIIIALIYVLEILTTTNGLITPTMLFGCTLWENVIMMIPRCLLLLLCLAVYRMQKERKGYV